MAEVEHPPKISDSQQQPRVRRDIIDTSGTVALRHNGRLTTSASAEPTPEPPS